MPSLFCLGASSLRRMKTRSTVLPSVITSRWRSLSRWTGWPLRNVPLVLLRSSTQWLLPSQRITQCWRETPATGTVTASPESRPTTDSSLRILNGSVSPGRALQSNCAFMACSRLSWERRRGIAVAGLAVLPHRAEAVAVAAELDPGQVEVLGLLALVDAGMATQAVGLDLQVGLMHEAAADQDRARGRHAGQRAAGEH